MPVLFRDTVTRQPLGKLALRPEYEKGFFVTPQMCTLRGGTFTVETRPLGIAAGGPSTEVPGYVAIDFPAVTISGDFSLLLYASSLGSPAGGTSTHSVVAGGSLGSNWFAIGSDSAIAYLDNNQSTAATGVFTTATVFIASRIGNQIKFYVNGELRSSDITGTRTGTITGLTFGRDRGVSNNPCQTHSYLFGVVPRGIAAAEAQRLKNPWAVYLPPARKLWLMGAAGGTTTITATGAADSPGQANAIGALVAAAQATAQAPAQAYATGALVAAAQATAQAPAQAYATGALVVAAAGVAHAAGQANASTGSAPIIVSGAGVAHAAGQASASAAATIAATGAAAAIAQANAFAAAVVAAAGSAQGVGQANGATGAAAPEFIEGNDAHYLLAHRRRNWPIAARQRDWLCQRHP